MLITEHWQRPVPSPKNPHLQGLVSFLLLVKKSSKKPICSQYPKKLKSIGDHLRKKRLDQKLRQKELADNFGMSKETISGWETNAHEPHLQYLPTLCEYLNYCPIHKAKNFGIQVKLWRTFKLGMSIVELAKKIGIAEDTLTLLEQQNKVSHQYILDRIDNYLLSNGWTEPISLRPKVKIWKVKPRFRSLQSDPRSLGDHLAHRREQLNLTQPQVADLLEIDNPTAVRLWENNIHRPSEHYYPKIMEFLGFCPMKYAKSEAELLRLYRQHKGLSTRDVEQLIGLPKNSVYRIENLGQHKCGSIEKLWQFYRGN